MNKYEFNRYEFWVELFLYGSALSICCVILSGIYVKTYDLSFLTPLLFLFLTIIMFWCHTAFSRLEAEHFIARIEQKYWGRIIKVPTFMDINTQLLKETVQTVGHFIFVWWASPIAWILTKIFYEQAIYQGLWTEAGAILSGLYFITGTGSVLCLWAVITHLAAPPGAEKEEENI